MLLLSSASLQLWFARSRVYQSRTAYPFGIDLAIRLGFPLVSQVHTIHSMPHTRIIICILESLYAAILTHCAPIHSYPFSFKGPYHSAGAPNAAKHTKAKPHDANQELKHTNKKCRFCRHVLGRKRNKLCSHTLHFELGLT